MVKKLKVALVHDYIKDAGGAERVLLQLTKLFPDAPIYTAFCIKDSAAHSLFKKTKIIESSYAPILKIWRLYSPLRFLLPVIWGSIDLSSYDLVVTSSSNYIARGFKVSGKTKVVVYCHTPPRFLYGMKTGMDWRKNIFIRIYGEIVAHFLRIFDYKSASNIDYWVANSENVKKRIAKHYRKESVVIYPPCNSENIVKESKKYKKGDYFFIASRLVGSKGIKEAILAANKLGEKLIIAGTADGFTSVENDLKSIAGPTVKFVGRVTDDRLWKLYAQAKGFVALAKDEDFGMSVVESQASGTPVLAYKGGGFLESVIEGETGIFVDSLEVGVIAKAMKKLGETKWDKKIIQKNALRFSNSEFEKKIISYLGKVTSS
jgi:glycosyltransferase involved in cell wall biosynthesis